MLVRHRCESGAAWFGAGDLDRGGARPWSSRSGLLPCARAAGPFVAVMSMVPPLALLPILFIVMGLGETSKIALIVIGIAPCMIRDLAMRVAGVAARAIDQGADAGRVDVADRAARRRAADAAAPHRLAAAARSGRPGCS